MKIFKYKKVGSGQCLVDDVKKISEWISKIEPEDKIEISCVKMSEGEWNNLKENALFWGL